MQGASGTIASGNISIVKMKIATIAMNKLKVLVTEKVFRHALSFTSNLNFED